MSRGIELDAISNTTKVVRRYLLALEDDHFEVLPGGILSKGIVRSYARVVGLDEGTWVERFLVASGQATTATDADWVQFASNVSQSRVKALGRPGMRLRWTGVALLLLVLVGFGWFVWRFVSGRVLAGELQQHAVTATATASPGGDTGQ